MSNPQEPQAERFCPKTGRPIHRTPAPTPHVAPGARPRSRHFLAWLAPLGGLLALAWFLIRVIPKPSRAAYPCQQAAFPVASAFVVWLVSVVGSALACRKARVGHGIALLCLVAAVSAAWWSWQDLPEPVAIASPAPSAQRTHGRRQGHLPRPGGLGPRSQSRQLLGPCRALVRPRQFRSTSDRRHDVQSHPHSRG